MDSVNITISITSLIYGGLAFSVLITLYVAYQIGRARERGFWVKAAQSLSTEKDEISIKDYKYVVLREDEYESLLVMSDEASVSET